MNKIVPSLLLLVLFLAACGNSANQESASTVVPSITAEQSISPEPTPAQTAAPSEMPSKVTNSDVIDESLSKDLKEYLNKEFEGVSWLEFIQQANVKTADNDYYVAVQTSLVPDEEAEKPANNIAGAVLAWDNASREDIYVERVVVIGTGDGKIVDRENNVEK